MQAHALLDGNGFDSRLFARAGVLVGAILAGPALADIAFPFPAEPSVSEAPDFAQVRTKKNRTEPCPSNAGNGPQLAGPTVLTAFTHISHQLVTSTSHLLDASASYVYGHHTSPYVTIRHHTS